MGSTETYLIDNKGNTVKTWHGRSRNSGTVYLLDSGNLLRSVSPKPQAIQTPFTGKVAWEYKYGAGSSNSTGIQPGRRSQRQNKISGNHIFRTTRLPSDHPGVVAMLD